MAYLVAVKLNYVKVAQLFAGFAYSQNYVSHSINLNEQPAAS